MFYRAKKGSALETWRKIFYNCDHHSSVCDHIISFFSEKNLHVFFQYKHNRQHHNPVSPDLCTWVWVAQLYICLLRMLDQQRFHFVVLSCNFSFFCNNEWSSAELFRPLFALQGYGRLVFCLIQLIGTMPVCSVVCYQMI